MRKLIKALSILCIAVLLATVMFSFGVSAVSGSTSIAFSSSTPKVGQTVTVTANFRLDTAVYGVEGFLKYDANILQYVGGEATSNPAAGTVKLANSANSSTANFTVTFKTIKEGTTLISLENCIASDGIDEFPVVGSAANMTVVSGAATPSAPSDSTPASSNANLNSITVAVGELSPAFSPDITEYTVIVPHDKTDGTISCKTASSYAKLSFAGERNLAVGITKRTVTVTAQNGDKKVYTVTFNRLDENGNDTTKPINDDRPEVVVNGVTLRVSDNFASLATPASLSVSTYSYKGTEVAALLDSTGKIVVMYLEAGEGQESSSGFYRYDPQNDSFSPLKFFDSEQKTYIFLELESGIITPSGFNIGTITVGSQTIECYNYTDIKYSSFAIVKVLSPSGNIGYYRFDINENTLQQYPEFAAMLAGSVNSNTVDTNSSQKIAIIVLLVLAVELIIALIVIAVVFVVKSKKQKNITQDEYDVLSDDDF